MKYAEIIIAVSNKNVDRIFTYRIPEKLSYVKLGMRVYVPFGAGNRKYEGYIIGFCNEVNFDKNKIKDILSIPDKYPVFSETMIELAKWMREKYYSNLSDCLKCIMPSIVHEKTAKYAYINKDFPNIYKIINDIIDKNNQQSKVLALLNKYDGITLNEIKIVAEVSDSPIKSLEKKGIIKIYDREVKREFENLYYTDKKSIPFTPTKEQQNAINTIIKGLNSDNKKPILIHGVTGCGKTEIYLQAIEYVIKSGGQAIVLVPEISLTPQTVLRFTKRFQDKVSVTHSAMSRSERFEQWKKAKNGEISIMVGPRSALFTPFENLKIIIIDEEHENTYKSDSTPKYDARDTAIRLCEIKNALTVFGSATPSIESYYNALNKKYELVSIKNRINKSYPNITVVDMRQELASGNRSIFSRELFNAIKNNLDKKQQTILFLNRRGHSTFVSCRSCGYVMACSNCNVNYTYHISSNKLMCHYCGKTENNPSVCPQCGSKYIKFFGIGTQKVEKEIEKLFPNARTLRMDLDTTRKKNGHNIILKKFSNGDADILIGTQMIAKGLDFPNVSVVGVIAADLSLNNGDYKCGENTFQLLTQVSGRAGRAEVSGNVYIQTYNPEHYSIVFAKDNNYIEFYKHEISIRRQMVYPPFSSIFFIVFTGVDEKKIITNLYKLSDIMLNYNRKGLFEFLGPAPCMISKIRKNYRWKLIVKSSDEEKLKSFVIYCLNKLKENYNLIGISVNISLNPSYSY